MLQLAKDAWEIVSIYQITPQDAQSGKHPQKNVSFNTECGGGIMSTFT
jgi:hypothetical protein